MRSVATSFPRGDLARRGSRGARGRKARATRAPPMAVEGTACLSGWDRQSGRQSATRASTGREACACPRRPRTATVLASSSENRVTQNPGALRTQDEGVVGTRVTLLGGKGGVGKTTLAASFAVNVASTTQQPTLIVSTDPAHSLSDALGQDVSGGKPVRVESYTSLPLWAMEIDPQRAKDEISEGVRREKDKKGASNPLASITGLLKLVGVDLDPSVFENLNLGDLLSSPPPGFDEILAIAKIMDFVTDRSGGSDAMASSSSSAPSEKFASIVIDTAPTGHTLRLLAAPELLDRSLGKVLAIKKTLDGASSLVKSIFTFGQQPNQGGEEDEAREVPLTERIENAQERLRSFGALLHNDKRTEFVGVTIPTQMAVSETIDLSRTLEEESIPMRRLIVNQVLPRDLKDGGVKLVEARQKDQEKAMAMLKDDAMLSALEQLTSPFLDLEVKGVPALQYFGGGLWEKSATLRDARSQEKGDQRFVIVGGKGGVGKTTTSSSLALSYAQEGHTVLIVSTDPAHSLSDSLCQDVSGGSPVLLEGTELPVYAMEINPEETMDDLRGLLQKAESARVEDTDPTGNPKVDLGKILEKVQDLKLGELLEEPPPGTDEAIAVAKVVQFSEKAEFAKFTRVVIDTAPTGHTLRLLTLPAFIALTIDKILKFRSVIAQIAGRSKADAAIEKLEDLQRQMNGAQALFRDRDKTEFVIVGIPTYLSVAESARLVRALKEESVFVRHVVVNQILDFGRSGEDDEERIKSFVARRLKEQEAALGRLEEDEATARLEISQAPVINMEVRGVPALEYFAGLVWGKD